MLAIKFFTCFIKNEFAKVRLNLQIDNIFLKIQHSVSALAEYKSAHSVIHCLPG
jgi:hypothetical protein